MTAPTTAATAVRTTAPAAARTSDRATGDAPLPAGGAARVALAALVGGTLAIAAAYAAALLAGPGGTAPGWAPWCLALGVPVCLVATMALGAVRDGRLSGRLLAPFLLVGAMLAGGFALALALPDLGAAEPLWLGLPRRAAVIVYGIGLLPVVVLPVVYALTFDALTLRPADLERVMAAAAERRQAAAVEPGREGAR